MLGIPSAVIIAETIIGWQKTLDENKRQRTKNNLEAYEKSLKFTNQPERKENEITRRKNLSKEGREEESNYLTGQSNGR